MKRSKIISAVTAVIIALSTLSASASEYIAASVTVQNSDPIAENITLTTYRNVGVSGRFRAIDPDGDTVWFEVTEEPSKGVLFLGDAGTFTYKPDEGKSGHDSFSYVAKDESGGVSSKANVLISIRRQSTSVFYSDMDDSTACYEAIRLAEEGIFTGDKLGDRYFFRPQECVSRGEFLAMCLEIADIDPLNDVSATSFSDNASTDSWIKPYISAALMNGYIRGYSVEADAPVFSANQAITSEEAAVMLNNILGITDAVSAASFDNSSVAVWAQSAAQNLIECGIVDEVSPAQITREEAAVMLSKAMDLIEEREKESKFILFR